MKITHHFVSTAADFELANGIVTIVRPLGPREADTTHGPMYLCRCVFGEFVAFHHELDFEEYGADPALTDAQYAAIAEHTERRRDARDSLAE